MLDVLLEIEGIETKQFAPGASPPPTYAQATMPRYRNILDSDRGLYLLTQPDEVESILAVLPPEGLFLGSFVATDKEADGLLRKATRWSARGAEAVRAGIASASTTVQIACILAATADLHFRRGLCFGFEIACMQQKRLKVWGKRGILNILLPLPRSQDGAVCGRFNDQRISVESFSAGDHAEMLCIRRRLQNHTV